MILEKLLEVPKKKTLQLITLIGLIAFVGMTVAGGLMLDAPKYGILDYEFAWTASRVNTIFNAWGSAGKQLTAIGIYMDFLYIIAYGSLMFGCLLIAARKLDGTLQTIGLIMAVLPWIAGICDAIENVALLMMIIDSAYINLGCPFVGSLFATIKFTILGICILFWLFELIVILIKGKN